MSEPVSEKPGALVVAASRSLVQSEIERLKLQGFHVSYHHNALDALASFAEEMPISAVIGPLDPHPATELLIEDLDCYGVPVFRALPASQRSGQRRSAFSRQARPFRNGPAERGCAPACGPANRPIYR